MSIFKLRVYARKSQCCNGQKYNNEGKPYKNGATGGVPNNYKQTIRNRLN